MNPYLLNRDSEELRAFPHISGFAWLTAFSEKVKKITGFSPLNYLINIRISEAINLLKQQDLPVTDIALDVGFYSSQHFATTFKKLTGYTPSEYRKKHMPVEVELSA
jgi:AraC-like DNA-binding protein